ncbi:MAG: acetyl-CoA carboxylase biotin carboxyl carrier protein [Bacteroidota bacterium]
MDIKQVQELVKIINKTNISEISIEEEGLKITIKQKEDAVQAVYSTAPAQQYYTQPAAPAPASAPPTSAPVPPKATEPAKNENYLTIKSPMIGTFYRSSAPDKPMFVNVGDEVDNGKVVCIIEAMKLFNEIESEIKGKIVKVLVEDASPVEYDQPLFLVEP